MAENPPAFPSQMLGSDGLPCSNLAPGMTLRDYFAAQALAGLVSATPPEVLDDIEQGVRAGGPIARGAYALADAMLAERERSNG